MTRALRYACLFFWVFGVGAGYAVYATHGLPHMIWSYTFWDNGDQYNPFADRHYTTCSFIGPYGLFTRDAHGGRCGWVRLFKERG